MEDKQQTAELEQQSTAANEEAAADAKREREIDELEYELSTGSKSLERSFAELKYGVDTKFGELEQRIEQQFANLGKLVDELTASEGGGKGKGKNGK